MRNYLNRYVLREEAGEGGSDAGGGGDSGADQHQEFIAEAMADGWKPEEEYNGKAPWVDAETFVKRGREINPILKKNNERLLKEIATLKAEVDKSNMSVKALQEHNAKIEEQAYARAIKDLKAQRKTAMTQGDLETVVQIEEEIDNLEEKKPVAKEEVIEVKKTDPSQDPILMAWVDENKSWYNDKNPEMLDYANSVGIRLRRQDPDNKLVGEAFLAEVLKAVKKVFPDRFSKRGGVSAVEGGASGGGRGGAGGAADTRIADLPKEARDAFKELSKEQWYVDLAKSQKLTTEQLYIKDYGV